MYIIKPDEFESLAIRNSQRNGFRCRLKLTVAKRWSSEDLCQHLSFHGVFIIFHAWFSWEVIQIWILISTTSVYKKGYCAVRTNGIVLFRFKSQSTWLCTSEEFTQLLKDLKRARYAPKILLTDRQPRRNSSCENPSGPRMHETHRYPSTFHFIRQCVNNGQIQMEYCPTEDMIADIATKALEK